MAKTEDELLAEEREVDLDKPVIPPPEVAAILSRGFFEWEELPKPHEYDIESLSSDDVSEILWDMYFNPDNPALAYIAKGKPLPDALHRFQEDGLLRIRWNDHYYRRTERTGDWYRLPQEYWLDGDQPLAEWPAAIRKIVRHSPRYWKLEFELTEKAARSAERAVRTNEIREATRPRIFEAKPGVAGFTFDLRAIWDWILSRHWFGAYRWR